MSNEVYKFNSSIQEKILAVLWLDSNSLDTYRDCIKPKYFVKTEHIDLCRIIYEYYDRYKKQPTVTALKQEVSKMASKSKKKQELLDVYNKTIDRLANYNLDDYGYIRDSILNFGKKQAMTDAIMECAELIEKGQDANYEKIPRIINSAMNIGDIQDIGVDFWEEAPRYIQELGQSGDEVDENNIFPTELGILDNYLSDGGLKRGELGVILAPPGRGKTTMMLNIARAGVMQGRSVVHISLENNTEQIIKGYTKLFLKKDKQYMFDNKENCIDTINRCKKYSRGGNLIIKKFKTKGITIDGIERYLQRLKVQKGIDPDMLVIDYGALIKPSVVWNDKRNTIESIYEDLRGLAEEFNAVCWTGAQGNRASLSKKVVTMEDLAEAFAIANTADFMITLCQTVKEKKNSEIRGFITKNRDYKGEVLLRGTINYETKRIEFKEDITSILEDEVEEDDEENKGYKKKGKKKNKVDEEEGNWEDTQERHSKRKQAQQGDSELDNLGEVNVI